MIKDLYTTFIEWSKEVGLTEILNYIIVVFNAIFVPLASRWIKNAKVKAIDAVATNKTITKAFNENQEKTDKEIAKLKSLVVELKEQNKEYANTLEKLGGIIALLIQNAKTNGNAKEYALKLFNIPTEVKPTTISQTDVVEEIKKEVEKAVHEQATKEEKGQYDNLVDELVNNYGK